jgi:hypothetical protein
MLNVFSTKFLGTPFSSSDSLFYQPDFWLPVAVLHHCMSSLDKLKKRGAGARMWATSVITRSSFPGRFDSPNGCEGYAVYELYAGARLFEVAAVLNGSDYPPEHRTPLCLVKVYDCDKTGVLLRNSAFLTGDNHGGD